MKQILPLFIAFLLMSFTDGNGPQITFTKEKHNFGKIPQGKPVAYEFEFTNTGDEPLLIMSVKASCGCTTPYYPTEPIAPGKTGKIKVVYNASAPRHFHKSVRIVTNIKNADGISKKEKVLFIEGEVISNSLEEKNVPQTPIRVN